jgi:multiple sugar transport system permease protein
MDYLQSVPRAPLVTIYLPLAIFVFVLLFPFYWMAITSVKPNASCCRATANPFWVIRRRWRTSRSCCSTPPTRLAVEHDDGVGGGHLPVAGGLGAGGLCDRAAALQGLQAVGLAIFLAYLVPPSILFIPLATMVFQLGLFDTRWR